MADNFSTFKTKLQTLQQIADSYASATKVANWLVLDTLRAGNTNYVDGSIFNPFNLTIGVVNQEFLNHLKNTNLSLYNYFVGTPRLTSNYEYANDPAGMLMDIPHLAVSMQGVLSTTTSNFDSYVTWAGDVASAIKQVNYGTADADTVIGHNGYSCSHVDIRSDLDAIGIMGRYKSDIQFGTKTIDSVFTLYFTNGLYGNRWSYFVQYIRTKTGKTFTTGIQTIMTGAPLVALSGPIVTQTHLDNYNTVVLSFCDYVTSRANSE